MKKWITVKSSAGITIVALVITFLCAEVYVKSDCVFLNVSTHGSESSSAFKQLSVYGIK